MWNLYQLQQTTGTRASDLIDLPNWTEELIGFPDPWAAIQFDLAVSWFGHYVEAKLNEFDDHGHSRYQLGELLSTREENTQKFISILKAEGLYINRD